MLIYDKNFNKQNKNYKIIFNKNNLLTIII